MKKMCSGRPSVNDGIGRPDACGAAMSTEIDYYELLECERTADDATIKTSYRKLAMKYHPDKNAGCKDSEAKFKAVSQAYDVLKDPQKRAAYDRFGHAAFQNGGGGGGAQDFGGFSDIFENIFGEFMGGRGGGRVATAARRGPALRHGNHAGGGVPRQVDRDHRRRDRGVRRLRRVGREAGHQRASLRDLPGPRQGSRATGFLRGRADLSDLSRAAARSSPIRARRAAAKAGWRRPRR